MPRLARRRYSKDSAWRLCSRMGICVQGSSS